ncbi:MAG TPA: hypothetical protein VJJ80_02970 [Patescibacteria group bacterium]|nr:hypothetical protein [Patescibacteria group bacterium]
MYPIPNEDQKWLMKHGRQDEQGNWWCKQTGALIQMVIINRSIWIQPFMGGGGDVRRVGHLCCERCNPNRIFPQNGTPIYEDDLYDPEQQILETPPTVVVS